VLRDIQVQVVWIILLVKATVSILELDLFIIIIIISQYSPFAMTIFGLC